LGQTVRTLHENKLKLFTSSEMKATFYIVDKYQFSMTYGKKRKKLKLKVINTDNLRNFLVNLLHSRYTYTLLTRSACYD
jgi:hypothetical protein